MLDTTRLIFRELQISGLTLDPFSFSTVWVVARMKVPLCECARSRVAKAASENDRNLTSSDCSGWIRMWTWACLLASSSKRLATRRSPIAAFGILACNKLLCSLLHIEGYRLDLEDFGSLAEWHWLCDLSCVL